MIPVGELMSRFPIIVAPRLPSAEALAIAREDGAHFLLVVDGSRLAGVARTCDLWHAAPDEAVQHCARTPVIAIAESEPVQLAWRLLTMTSSGCLVVTNGRGALRGVLTCEELSRAGCLLLRSAGGYCHGCGTTQHLIFVQPDDPALCCVCASRAPATSPSL